MKKVLLTLAAAVLGAAAATAASYAVFPVTGLAWTGDANGYTTTATVDGKSFTLTSAKASSTNDLMQPSADQIRVYKNSTFTITSTDAEFTTVLLESTGGNYGGTQTIPEGWTQKYEGTTLTCTSATPQKTFTLTASNNQYRIKGITLTDGEGGGETPIDPVEPEVVTVKTVAATKALAAGTKVKVDYDLTVGFANAGNIFVCDAAGDFIQVYKQGYVSDFKQGEVIPAGWEGEYTVYITTPEIVFTELPATKQGTFKAKEVAASALTADMVNSVVLVKNVVFDAATPADKSNYTGTCGGTTLTFRNNYVLAAQEAGTYDVEVVVSVYNGNVQLYPIAFTATSGEGPVVPEPGEEGEYTVLASQLTVPGECTVEGFTFNTSKNDGATAPAYNATADALRLYANNTLTISAKNLKKIVFTLDAKNYAKRYCTITANTGTLSTQTAEDTEITWTGDAESVTITIPATVDLGTETGKAAQLHVSSFTITGTPGAGTPVVPPTPETEEFVLATSFVDGAQYVFTVNLDGQDKVATAIAETATYGRLNLTNVTITDNTLSTVAENAITINRVGEECTLKDAYGRYFGFDGEHTTSFQLYTEVNEFTNWSADITAQGVKFTNTVAEKTATVGVTKGTNDTWYTNVAPSVDAAEILLPVLYIKKSDTGIENITADSEAPVEFYNLQGIRVANPENGIYIRRQGNKVSKVIIR